MLLRQSQCWINANRFWHETIVIWHRLFMRHIGCIWRIVHHVSGWKAQIGRIAKMGIAMVDSVTIINRLKKYFDIRELVSKDVYNYLGQDAWALFDIRLLHTLLVLREEILGVPIVVNNWKAGGSLSQRGFRENTCEIVRQKTANGSIYISAHCEGMGIDFSSPSKDADEIRRIIASRQAKLPYNIRCEYGSKATTWVHIDVRTKIGTKAKISWF